MAVKEMKNYVIVEGILSEVGLKEAQFMDRNTGKPVDCISGDITVRVNQEVEKGQGAVTLDVPVRFFAKKLTNAGNINPSYTSLKSILDEAESIAVVGEDMATAVRVTGASLTMQEYYAPDGRLITYPSIKASFVNIIRRSDMASKAKFDCEMVIAKMGNKLDKDGVEITPETLEVVGVTVGYGEYTDILPFISRRPDIIKGIPSMYDVNDTISLSGVLNFSTKTETYLEPVEIGDPIEKSRTIRVSEMVITGVSPRGVASENYDLEDIKLCLAKRTTRLAEAEKKAKMKGGTSTGTRTKVAEKTKIDLGF